MILNDKQIRDLIVTKELIKEYIDLETQLQSHGFDITVNMVYRYTGNPPVIDFSNEKRRLPEYTPVNYSSFMADGWYLSKGTYLVRFNEEVKLPPNMKAIGIHRSTVIRCDCNMSMGNWDAGYNGKGMTRLEVGKNGLNLYKNARLCQLIFMTTDEAEELYNGIYQKEEIE